MAKKYDGWCMKTEWLGIMPWTLQRTRAEVVKDWDSKWNDDKFGRPYKWCRLRKRGTHKIVKVRIAEVSDAS